MKPMITLVVLLVVGAAAGADDKPRTGAPDVVERYVAGALAGKVDDTAALAVKGKSPTKKKRIEELKTLVGAGTLKLDRVLVGENKGQAIAVSQAVRLTKANPDGRNSGRLVFGLVKSGNHWLVRDIDFPDEEGAKEKVKAFRKKNADAKEIGAREKK
jgi:hypothetical protein